MAARRRAEKPKDYKLMIRMDREMWDAIREEADRQDRDISPFVRILIADGLERLRREREEAEEGARPRRKEGRGS